MHRGVESRTIVALYGASPSGQFVPGVCCVEDWWTKSGYRHLKGLACLAVRSVNVTVAEWWLGVQR